MLKSVAVVAGSYLLSILLVLCTDPLLSLLFPARLRSRPHSLRHGPRRQHGALCHSFDSLRLALRSFCAEPPLAARTLVLHHRGSHGYCRDHSELEQGMASLVLVILAAHLAGELLDRPANPLGQSAG